MEVRLRRRVVVPLGLAGAAGVVALLAVALAPAGSSGPGASIVPSAATVDCARVFARRADEVTRSTWFTFRERDDADGSLVGYVLNIATTDVGAIAAVELPTEAFADGPYDGGALVGADDGDVSVLRFVAPRGCGRVIQRTSDVILRRATISPDQRQLITFRLDRANRADRGVWIAPIEDPDQSRQLLPPLAPSADFGVTYATTLRWSEDGRLLVESCGQSECRYRIVDPATGDSMTVDDRGYDQAIGLVGDRLYLMASCGARPCAVVERNLGTGATRELLPGALSATLVTRGQRSWLVASVYTGPTTGLAVVDLDGGGSRPLALPSIAAGLALVVDGPGGSVGLPRGWIALAPEGRLPSPNAGGRLLAFDVETSRLAFLLGGRP